MNRRQERIAGYIATCSGVLAGSLAGGMVGSLLALTLFPDSPASGFSPGLIVAYVCVLIGAMLCCWMTQGHSPSIGDTDHRATAGVFAPDGARDGLT